MKFVSFVAENYEDNHENTKEGKHEMIFFSCLRRFVLS